ncbi:MAG: hypothetical protein K5866_01505 [Treponema sp.]|nr:hypothetical protein [Treponema sp.]
MKKFFKAMILALAVMFVATSCTTFKAENLSYGQFVGQDLGNFNTSVTVWKILGPCGGTTLFNLGQDATAAAVTNAIQKEVTKKGGNAAVGVKISQNVTFFDTLINALTFSILAPVKVKVSGTVILMD